MGSYADTKWLEARLREAWALTVRGVLGPKGYKDCVLGRIIGWTDEGITWEADPRHAEIVRKAYGVTTTVVTPGVKIDSEAVDNEVPLEAAEEKRYRSMTMRAQYLSADRPETQFSCRERARRMQDPTTLDETELKRIARFYNKEPRTV